MAKNPLAEQLIHALDEGLEAGEKPCNRFTDGPDTSLLKTMASLSPEQASRPVGGRSIAQQANHVLFALDASAAWLKGDRTQRDWDQSWGPEALDAAGWQSLQNRLREAHRNFRHTIEIHGTQSGDAVGSVLGVIAHVAYHLGVIRQKVTLLKLT